MGEIYYNYEWVIGKKQLLISYLLILCPTGNFYNHHSYGRNMYLQILLFFSESIDLFLSPSEWCAITHPRWKKQKQNSKLSAQHSFSIRQRWKKGSCPETCELGWKNHGCASGSRGPYRKANLLSGSL